jgi:excinuclease UvrABC nuclease subunit
MARKLEVTPQQRSDMLAAVSAVLHREAAAVASARAALERLRDTASEQLAFERAQRLHLELAALEWICATQRATAIASEDLVFFGWSADTLVRFEIVSGRLCDWQFPPCTLPMHAARGEAESGHHASSLGHLR